MINKVTIDELLKEGSHVFTFTPRKYLICLTHKEANNQIFGYIFIHINEYYRSIYFHHGLPNTKKYALPLSYDTWDASTVSDLLKSICKVDPDCIINSHIVTNEYGLMQIIKFFWQYIKSYPNNKKFTYATKSPED